MALNNIKHTILIASSSEDSIVVNENDPEENEESVTEDDKNMNMQSSHSLHRDGETSMQYKSLDDAKLPTVSPEMSIFVEECNMNKQNQLDSEEISHYEQSQTLDSIQHDMRATIYDESLESTGTRRQDVTINTTSNCMIHSDADHNAGLLQFNSVIVSMTDHYDDVICTSDTDDLQPHIIFTSQEADIFQYTASSDLPSFTDEPKLIDHGQNSQLRLASEDYIKVDTCTDYSL